MPGVPWGLLYLVPLSFYPWGLCFPKVNATASPIPDAPLQCDFVTSHPEVESNLLSFSVVGLGLLPTVWW